MSRSVIDASVAIKWVVSEPDSDAADTLLTSGSFVAPDLILAECANILWKKVQRGQLGVDIALAAARTLELADIELRPMTPLIAEATQMAVELGHPAYDCFYLALARRADCPFITADETLIRKIGAWGLGKRIEILNLKEAARRV